MVLPTLENSSAGHNNDALLLGPESGWLARELISSAVRREEEDASMGGDNEEQKRFGGGSSSLCAARERREASSQPSEVLGIYMMDYCIRGEPLVPWPISLPSLLIPPSPVPLGIHRHSPGEEEELERGRRGSVRVGDRKRVPGTPADSPPPPPTPGLPLQ